MHFKDQLKKVMQPEFYKGFMLRQVDTNKWQFGIKTFTSKQDLKDFIDTFAQTNSETITIK